MAAGEHRDGGVGEDAPGVAQGALEAVVLDILPHAAYRVELATRQKVVAHAAGATAANFVRLRPRDRVLVELSPHDPSRGRILKVL